MSANDIQYDSNCILVRLPREELQLLKPDLEEIDLPVRKMLAAANKPIEHMYFVGQGFASIVANGEDRRQIEVGMIGREGATGTALVVGSDRMPHDTYMQVSGRGYRIAAVKLRKTLDQSPTLRQLLLQFVHVFMVQTAQTALANGRGKIEERLARWLLMAQDRIGGDQLPLTHEFLAIMLGVRRPGVTVALNLLEKEGLIKAARGVVAIIDREGLEDHSNGTYGTAEAEYRRLFK
jgi:CRP-like cAMP-binding protein